MLSQEAYRVSINVVRLLLLPILLIHPILIFLTLILLVLLVLLTLVILLILLILILLILLLLRPRPLIVLYCGASFGGLAGVAPAGARI